MFGGAGSCSRNLWGASRGQEFLHTSPLPRLPPLAPLPPTCGRCTLQFSSRPSVLCLFWALSQGWWPLRAGHIPEPFRGQEIPWDPGPALGPHRGPRAPESTSVEKRRREKDSEAGPRSEPHKHAAGCPGGGVAKTRPHRQLPRLALSLRLSAPSWHSPASPLPSQSLHSPKCKITGCCQDWTS